MIAQLVAELAVEAMRLSSEAERAGPAHRPCVQREARWARLNGDLAQILQVQAEDRALLLARLDRLEHQLSRSPGERIRRLLAGFWGR